MITFRAKDASGEIINSALHEFTFPAGEKHIKHAEHRELEAVEIAIFQPTPTSIHDDLFAIAMWNDYVVQNGPNTRTVLIMPYVPGARADRGAPFGLGVYTDFINAMEIDQIIIFDPHSQKTVEMLDTQPVYATDRNITVVYSDELFAQKHMTAVLNGYDGIIAPDKGAELRAKAVAEVAGLPVFTATKHRDEETGKLSNFSIEGLDPDGFYLIVDDICDGGGTFLGLATASGLDEGHLDLFVSHGVFSKDALSNLEETFEYVFTTNSYDPARALTTRVSEFQDESRAFRRFDVIRLLLSKVKY